MINLATQQVLHSIDHFSRPCGVAINTVSRMVPSCHFCRQPFGIRAIIKMIPNRWVLHDSGLQQLSFFRIEETAYKDKAVTLISGLLIFG